MQWCEPDGVVSSSPSSCQSCRNVMFCVQPTTSHRLHYSMATITFATTVVVCCPVLITMAADVPHHGATISASPATTFCHHTTARSLLTSRHDRHHNTRKPATTSTPAVPYLVVTCLHGHHCVMLQKQNDREYGPYPRPPLPRQIPWCHY